MPEKTIWIYSGYEFHNIFRHFASYGEYIGYPHYDKNYPDTETIKRQKILEQCDVMVDGRYIDSQRNLQLKYRGSENQRVIDIQETIKQNYITLYCD